MTELFERRQGDGRHTSRQNGSMTRAAYNDVGGVLGALGRRAEMIFSDLDEVGCESTRQLFLRLVTLGEGVEDTRRRVLRSELETLGESGDVEASGRREQPTAPENQQPAADNQQVSSSSRPPASNLQISIAMIIDTFGAARLLTFDHDPVT